MHGDIFSQTGMHGKGRHVAHQRPGGPETMNDLAGQSHTPLE
jgi:hypothetical protein